MSYIEIASRLRHLRLDPSDPVFPETMTVCEFMCRMFDHDPKADPSGFLDDQNMVLVEKYLSAHPEHAEHLCLEAKWKKSEPMDHSRRSLLQRILGSS